MDSSFRPNGCLAPSLLGRKPECGSARFMGYAESVAGRHISIQGSGVAAACCLQLLEGQGYSTETGLGTQPGRLPAILVSQSTQKLLSDIFRSSGLFAGWPRIRQRIVAWGARE